jgi:hypothetical protein
LVKEVAGYDRYNLGRRVGFDIGVPGVLPSKSCASLCIPTVRVLFRPDLQLLEEYKSI